MRSGLVAFVAGTAWVQCWPAVPPWWVAALAAAAALAGACRLPRVCAPGWRRTGATFACCLALGVCMAAGRADWRLRDGLSPGLENTPLGLSFQVAGLAVAGERGQRFDAVVLSAPRGVPARVALSWPDPAASPVPGQVWRASAVLKRPHGNANPHGFDYEAYLFERGIRATGTLRGRPRLLADAPLAGFDVAVQRVRHAARAALRRALGDARYGAVLIALAMGDQASVDRRDWDTFSRTGITHLVSISGLHVTMLAAMAGWAMLQLWKRCRWRGLRLCERQPAQIAAAVAALAAAWLYCLLAGWGVPAQRTFFMLAVVAGAHAMRLPLSSSRVLALAAALVCALDPWAALAPGFWLSFGAVAMLVLGGAGRWRWRDAAAPAPGWRARLWATLHEGTRAQAILTAGLLPLLALLFQQVSLVSPLANALAIPTVSLVVTPLALLAMLVCVLPGGAGPGQVLAQGAHAVFEALMNLLQPLAGAPYAQVVLAAPPAWMAALALAGVLWSLQPRGLPLRRGALLLVLPMLVYRPARPGQGDWRMSLLDVGQGSAIVIETAHATVLYDTGPRLGTEADAGNRIVWPFLRARGVRELDDLVVSHADADHAGGLASILAMVPARRLRASYEIPPGPGAAFSWCLAGQAWTLDGVEFAFLFPRASTRAPAGTRNDSSCVLRVRGRHHSALLTGDIGVAQERQLDARDISVDVVAAPHHGSRFSSGAAFVEATRATHVVAQAGYLNRYHHPHPDTVARWRHAGGTFHRTDLDGAVTVASSARGLTVTRERQAHRRYWHAQ